MKLRYPVYILLICLLLDVFRSVWPGRELLDIVIVGLLSGVLTIFAEKIGLADKIVHPLVAAAVAVAGPLILIFL